MRLVPGRPAWTKVQAHERSEESCDRFLLGAALTLVAWIIWQTNFWPVWSFTFYADDYVFLNWAGKLDARAWLGEFLYSDLYNLTYRPLVKVVYLIYLLDDPRFGYALLSGLHALNIFLAFRFYRCLAGGAAAALATLFFAAGFIYYDATHAIYNLATQFSAAFFLAAVLFFVASLGAPGAGRAKFFACVFYALSIATYEVTFFGFVVFFALAVHEAAKNSRPVAGALLWAGKRVFPFGLIAAGYVLANLLNPRKALHLREHSAPLDLAGMREMLERAWLVGTNSLKWILAVDRRDAALAYLSLESVVFFLAATAAIAWLLREVGKGARSLGNPPYELFSLALLGMIWFGCILLPGALSIYFDYRLLYLAYVGFALVLACATLALQWLFSSLPHLSSWASAALAVVVALWLFSNLSLVERMNRNLGGAQHTEQVILQSMRRYLPAIPDDAVIAVRYDHRPIKTLPYTYQASPFNEDHGFENALRYYFGKSIAGASVFFAPGPDSFAVGRFQFNRVSYSYARLVLFDYARDNLELQREIEVSGKRIALVLSDRLIALP